MAASKVIKLSKKIIKPSSPTPKQLRNYKLSFMDQLLTFKYLPITLFFPNHCFSGGASTIPATSAVLEESLSELLTLYYPYAGRLVGNVSVDCNDMGAEFREVQIKSAMSDILKEPFFSVQSTVFPSGVPWRRPKEGESLAVAQLNHFDCGGKALSLCLPHKLGNNGALSNFLLDWAALARKSGTPPPSPLLTGASILPPADDPLTQVFYEMKKEEPTAARRLSFDALKIDRLKAIVASESQVKNPTRTEVVSALLNRCLVDATMAAAATSDPPPSPFTFDPFVIYFPFNFRRLTKPPLQKLVGNALSFLIVQVSDYGDLKLSTLVSKIRREKLRHLEVYQGMAEGDIYSAILREKTSFPRDPRLTTSLCMFPFYEADFGWGRPSRVSYGASPTKNNFILLDAPPEKRGGVDVIATLDESVMPLFEGHDELLEFASLDPSF